jgi:hypothetical protein
MVGFTALKKTIHLQIDISWDSGHRIPSEKDNDSV